MITGNPRTKTGMRTHHGPFRKKILLLDEPSLTAC